MLNSYILFYIPTATALVILGWVHTPHLPSGSPRTSQCSVMTLMAVLMRVLSTLSICGLCHTYWTLRDAYWLRQLSLLDATSVFDKFLDWRSPKQWKGMTQNNSSVLICGSRDQPKVVYGIGRWSARVNEVGSSIHTSNVMIVVEQLRFRYDRPKKVIHNQYQYHLCHHQMCLQ